MPNQVSSHDQGPKPGLIRELNLFDVVLLGIGSVVGSALFLTTGDIAQSVPSGFWIIAVWVGAGLVALTGALTYGELGGLLPKAGGQYLFLKEAYGSLPGFLYGWTFFLIIWNGSNAAIATGFTEYLSYLVPSLSFQKTFLRISILGFPLSLSTGQLIAASAIIFLTFVNYFGLKLGKPVQNSLTGLKILLIALFIILGFSIGRGGHLNAQVLFSKEALRLSGISAFGVALIAAVWAYDGWYSVAFMASEMKKATKNIALSMILAISSVIAIYVLINFVYLHALPVSKIVGVTRIGEVAATALFGSLGAPLLSVVILISAFGCLNSCIISAPRMYYAMAEDGLFFKKLAAIHPRYHSPGPAIIAQGAWSAFLCLTGKYRNLYEFVVFGALFFACFTGAAVFVLRRKYPDRERPYRTWGYPVTPLIFIIVNAWIFINQCIQKPRGSAIGAAIIIAGLPAYLFWTKRKK
jgi:APA family basic amino acid/polyamine antiporter